MGILWNQKSLIKKRKLGTSLRLNLLFILEGRGRNIMTHKQYENEERFNGGLIYGENNRADDRMGF